VFSFQFLQLLPIATNRNDGNVKTNRAAASSNMILALEHFTNSFHGLKISILWDKKQYSPLKVNRRFGGIFCLHLQDQKIKQARNVGSLLGLFFDPKYESEIFLRNVEWLSKYYVLLYPGR
jgi:hypothetical protein